MFYALTGRPVFDGPSVQAVLSMRFTDTAPPIATIRPELPRRLAEAVDRCLARDPAARFGSAEELAAGLGEARAAAPEMPAELVRVSQEASRLGIEIGAVLGLVIPQLVNLYEEHLRPSEGFSALFDAFDYILAGTLGAFGIGLIAVRIAEFVAEARNAVLQGFSESHIRLGLREFAESRPQEGRPVSARLRTAVFVLIVAALWFINDIVEPDWMTSGDWTWLAYFVGVVAFLGPFVLARSAAKRSISRGGRVARWWHRCLAGPVGTPLFKLAAWRLPKGSRAPAAAEPTEVLLLDAVESIFKGLPVAYRQRLADVPDLVKRLERHAESLRRRRDELDRALGEAGLAGNASPNVRTTALGERAEVARAALSEAHHETNLHLADVLSALETIRLNLLRVRAGVAAPEDLTADLALAREVGLEVDALMQGHAAVTRLLESTSTHR
jgi:serine/threonine-protein kinase